MDLQGQRAHRAYRAAGITACRSPKWTGCWPSKAPPRPPRRAPPAQPPAPRGVLVALSSRNQLRGIVDEVRHDGLLAQVRLRIGDQRLTAVITRDALVELGLRRGDEAVAIIKSTEVMIGREQLPPAPKRGRARLPVR